MFFLHFSVAIATKESLETQKKSLSGITHKMTSIASILYKYNVGRKWIFELGGFFSKLILL